MCITAGVFLPKLQLLCKVDEQKLFHFHHDFWVDTSNKFSLCGYLSQKKNFQRTYKYLEKLFFKLEVHIYYKYGTIYRKVMYLPPVEWCHLVKFGSTNVLTKFIFDLTDQSAPGVVHPCPYKKVNVTKAQINAASARSAFASGDYKSSFIFNNEKQALLFSVHFVFSVNSSDKNSFG